MDITPAILVSMHQHPRSAPRAASAANSPQTNPTRTNNPRDPMVDRSPSNIPYNERFGGEGYAESAGDERLTGRSRDDAKLNQVIQVYCSCILD